MEGLGIDKSAKLIRLCGSETLPKHRRFDPSQDRVRPRSQHHDAAGTYSAFRARLGCERNVAISASIALFLVARKHRSLLALSSRWAWQWSAQNIRLARPWVVLVPLLLGAACDHPAGPASGTPPASEWHTFEGSWSASGSRQTISLGASHRASIFDLTGSLVLTGDRGLGVGFRAKAIGFTDSLAGMQGRSVWTDEHGDRVFSELKGEMVGTGNRITGTFLGGTGRFAGVTGEYSFRWEYVVESDDGTLSGRSVDLKGRARFNSATVAPAGEQRQ
jgi:hypothetical protein